MIHFDDLVKPTDWQSSMRQKRNVMHTSQTEDNQEPNMDNKKRDTV